MAPYAYKPTKRVVVEVTGGGDVDGFKFDTSDPDPIMVQCALMLYQGTSGGKLGYALAGTSLGRTVREHRGDTIQTPRGQAHFYVVTERVERDNELLLWVRHQTTPPTKPAD
jgi:hypothetical protein